MLVHLENFHIYFPVKIGTTRIYQETNSWLRFLFLMFIKTHCIPPSKTVYVDAERCNGIWRQRDRVGG